MVRANEPVIHAKLVRSYTVSSGRMSSSLKLNSKINLMEFETAYKWWCCITHLLAHWSLPYTISHKNLRPTKFCSLTHFCQNQWWLWNLT